jgi:hypothetical protein
VTGPFLFFVIFAPEKRHLWKKQNKSMERKSNVGEMRLRTAGTVSKCTRGERNVFYKEKL